MRKVITLFAIVLFIIGIKANAQSTANYTYSTLTTGSMVDMSSGTGQLVAPSVDDGASVVVSIGFDFWFQGTRFTQFSASSNGNMGLGPVAVSTSYYLVGLTAATNIITAYGADQRTTALGKVHYKVTGSVGSRVLVVEWKNMCSYFSATGETSDLTYQVHLYESTGVIEFAYAQANMSTNGAGSVNSNTPRIGISSSNTATTTGYITAPQSGSPVPSYTAGNPSTNSTYTVGVITVLNSASDGSRRIFDLTPPTPLAPTGLNFTAVTTTGMTLNWTDNATNEVGYVIYRSDDGGTTYNFIAQIAANSVSYAATGLGSGSTYFWKVYAVTEGNLGTPAAGSQATTSGTICGTLTVGPTGTYASITAALTAITTNGLCGNTILELQSTYLSAVETFPIAFNNTLPTGPNATLTIRPQTGAAGLVITSAVSPTINLNGARNITFDGRPGGSGVSQLTITNTLVTAPSLQYINDARFNTIKYCTISGVNSTAGTSGVVLFSTTTGTLGNSNNTIDNCTLKDGATTPANLICSNGTATVPNMNNTISNSNLSNWFLAATATQTGAINLVAGCSDWTITGCSFYQTATRTFTSTGVVSCISVNNTTQSVNYTITNNYFGGSAPLCAGGPLTYTQVAAAGTGPVYRFLFLSHTNGVTSTISGNTFQNISLTSSSSSTVHSLISHNNGNVLISNNTIGSQSTTGNISYICNSTTAVTANFIGILTGGGATGALITVTNNNIGSITGSATTLGAVSIRLINGGAPVGSTLLINNNTLGGTVANSVQELTSAGFFAGIVSSSVCQSITITGNTIQNLTGNNAASTLLCVAGIHYQSNGTFTITNNIIRNLTNNSATVSFGNTPNMVGISNLTTTLTLAPSLVSGNQIYNLTSTNPTVAGYMIGINIFPATVAQTYYTAVTKNLIYGFASASPSMSQVGFTHLYSTLGGPAYFSNNMIRLGIDASGVDNTNSNIFGIIKQSIYNCGFYHNSIYIGGSSVTNGSSACYDRTVSGTADSVMDNIFVNNRSNSTGVGKHYVNITNASTVLTMKYNCGYGTGTGFVYGSNAATDYSSLVLWQGGTGLDGNSIQANPQFLNPTTATPDLHISGFVPTPIEASGFALSQVTDDYDGQSRAGLTPTDIGADAGNFSPLDLSPPSITYTLLSNTNSTSNRAFTSVTISDPSGVNGTSGTKPRCYYKRSTDANTFNDNTNGTDGWKYVEGNTSVSPFDFTIDYSLLNGGGGVAINNIVQYFVCAQDLAGTPNVGINSGAFATTPSSVALTAAQFPITGTINSYQIVAPPMAGNYYIGVTMFNKLSGHNLYQQKLTRIVKKMVPDESDMQNKAIQKGSKDGNIKSDRQDDPEKNYASITPKQTQKMKEVDVEEVYYELYENGKKYNGPLSADLPSISNKKQKVNSVPESDRNTQPTVNGSDATNIVNNIRVNSTQVNSESVKLDYNGQVLMQSLSADLPVPGSTKNKNVVTENNVVNKKNEIINVSSDVDLPGQQYATITAAFADITARGMSGAVTFILTDPTYTTETFPLTLGNSISGASGTNTITLHPDVGVTAAVTGSVATGVIFKILNSNTIIDGSNSGGTDRSLTITNSNVTTPSVMLVGSTGTTPITNVTIKNCVLINGINSSSNTVISDGTTLGGAGYFSNITIQNNDIRTAYIGVYATGGTTPQNGSNLSYINNVLNNSGAASIRYTGLYMQGVNGATISGNTIGNFDGTSSEDDNAMWLATGTINAVVEKNNISSMNYTGTGGYGAHGMYITPAVTSANITIRNNQIYNLSGDGWNYSSIPTDNTIGICLGSATASTQTGINIYNNSINFYGNTLNQTSALAQGIFLGNGTSGVDIRNNCIVNNLGLLAALGQGSCGIYAWTGNTQFTNSNYNNIYINPTGSGSKEIGRFSATNYLTMATWRTATTFDAYSFSTNPNYISNTDLHITASSLGVSGRGTYIAAVTDDYDGNARQTAQSTSKRPNDVGCDQYTPAGFTANTTVLNGSIYQDGGLNAVEIVSGTFSVTNVLQYPGVRSANNVMSKNSGTKKNSIDNNIQNNIHKDNNVKGKDGKSGGESSLTAVNEPWIYWEMPGYTPTTDVVVRFYYNVEMLATITEANLRVTYWTGTAWENSFLPQSVNTTSHYIQVTLPLSYAWGGSMQFAIEDNTNPLPVSLCSFTSSAVNNDVNLAWSTCQEVNNKGFNVERRMLLDEKTSRYTDWSSLTFINGFGNSNEQHNYVFADKRMTTGKYEYRLKQVDFNSNAEYFSLGSLVDVGKPNQADIKQNYPNPSNPKSKIDFQIPFDGKVSLKVYDETGREIATLLNETKQAGYYSTEFDGTNLASGVYFYRIFAEGGGQKFTKTMKMILVK